MKHWTALSIFFERHETSTESFSLLLQWGCSLTFFLWLCSQLRPGNQNPLSNHLTLSYSYRCAWLLVNIQRPIVPSYECISGAQLSRTRATCNDSLSLSLSFASRCHICVYLTIGYSQLHAKTRYRNWRTSHRTIEPPLRDVRANFTVSCRRDPRFACILHEPFLHQGLVSPLTSIDNVVGRET